MEIRCTMMCDNSFQCKFNFSGVDISITWDSHLVRSQNGMMMMFETKQFLSVILATNHQTHIRLYIQCLHQQYRLCKVAWIHFKLEWWRLSKQNHFYLHLFAKPYPSRWLPINQSITDQTTCGHMGFTWCRITCNGNMVLSSDGMMMMMFETKQFLLVIMATKPPIQSIQAITNDNIFLAKIQIHKGRTNRGC